MRKNMSELHQEKIESESESCVDFNEAPIEVSVKKPAKKPKSKSGKPRKRKSAKKPPGRPPKPTRYLPYEEAREIVRGECIGSKIQYFEWWDRNKPPGLPRRPDAPYAKNGFTWSSWLGVNNSFGTDRFNRGYNNNKNVRYRPLEEVKKFAALHGVTDQQRWYELARSQKFPQDIPTRPDIVFSSMRRRLINEQKWLGWNDFFKYSKSINSVENKIDVVQPILYIATSPSNINNVFIINVIGGGVYELKKHITSLGVKLIAAFYTTIDAEHKSILKTLNNYIYGQKDEYLSYNIWEIISDLEMVLEKVQLT